jgi:hypothetical protein
MERVSLTASASLEPEGKADTLMGLFQIHRESSEPGNKNRVSHLNTVGRLAWFVAESNVTNTKLPLSAKAADSSTGREGSTSELITATVLPLGNSISNSVVVEPVRVAVSLKVSSILIGLKSLRKVICPG